MYTEPNFDFDADLFDPGVVFTDETDISIYCSLAGITTVATGSKLWFSVQAIATPEVMADMYEAAVKVSE